MDLSNPSLSGTYEDGEFTALSVSGNAGGESVEYPIAENINKIVADTDVFFVLLSGYMVFFMQCGFAMLSAGSIRSKNAKNIILKNLLDACFGALGFYLLGYGFAYGGDVVEGKGNSFIGWHGFALNGLPKSGWYSWFFQFAFAATATTIVSGAVAERTKFEGYLLYATILTSFVYPVVVHWVWSGTGWASAFKGSDLLFDTGVIDFAGCGVVHMVGGLAALAGAWVVGPRIGAYDAEGKPTGIAGHSASFAVLGVFILWFGWYGFNPGSALAINGVSEVVALCAINTTLSAAAGTVSTLVILMIIELKSTGHLVWDLIGASNGSLAGLVGITAACSVAEPWGAICIGIISGAIYVGASYLMSHILKIDDPLDAVAVHCFCGAWGLIAAAAFAHKPNIAAAYSDELANTAHGFLMSGGNGKLLAAAIVLILAITGWVLGLMIPFFFAMKFAGLLRVDESEERAGLDISHHGGSAYESDQVKEASNGSDMALLNRINALENELRSMYRSREGEKVHAPNKMQ